MLLLLSTKIIRWEEKMSNQNKARTACVFDLFFVNRFFRFSVFCSESECIILRFFLLCGRQSTTVQVRLEKKWGPVHYSGGIISFIR